MKQIYANNFTTLELGRKGENLARQVVFDVRDLESLYGPGDVEVIYQRPGDAQPYPLAVQKDGTLVTWDVTATDTEMSDGYGKCELRYYVGDMLAKSKTWRTRVKPALPTPSETAPPEPEQGWVEQVLAAKQTAEKAAADAKADADRVSSLAAEVAVNAAQTAQDASKAAKAMEAAQTAQRLAAEAQGAAEAARTAAAAAQAATEKAATDAAGAKQDAETAQKAAHDAAAAAANTLESIQTLYQEMQTWSQGVIQDVNAAGSAAVQSVQSAGDTQVQRVTDEGATQTANAKAQADAAAQSASGAAQSAQEASESAAVYDTVLADVNQLKQDVAAITPDDAAVNGKPWTSKKIVDSLCSPFEESGNPVQCYPVENYPLGVKVSWEPTQEGSGDPSPDNIRPITGRDAVSVTRCGKNLSKSNAFGDVTWAYTDANTTKLINSLSAGTYKISLTITLNKFHDRFTSETVPATGLYARYYVHDGSQVVRDINLVTPQTIYRTDTLPKSVNISADIVIAEEDVGYRKQIYFYGCGRHTYAEGAPDGPLGTAEVSNLQIELGSTATPYEPYTGDTYDIALPETVYGGEMDAVSGEGQETWKTLTLDGTERWARQTTSTPGKYGFTFQVPEIATPTSPSIKGDIVCSQYPTVTAEDTYRCKNGISVEANVNHYFRIYNDTYAGGTIDEWKSYLASQYAAGTPVQVCYKLAEPVPFTATGTQPIHALSGVNTLYTDADGVVVTGAEDPKHTITELKNAIISLGGNI